MSVPCKLERSLLSHEEYETIRLTHHPAIYHVDIAELEAMVPLSDPPKTDPLKAELDGKPVLLLSGQNDPIVPASNSGQLAALLLDAGARVDHRVLPAGHQLSQADVTLARNWIGSVEAKAA